MPLQVTGHVHGYERVHPNIAGNVTDYPTRSVFLDEDVYVRPAAPLHLMVGHGGAVQEFALGHNKTAWVPLRSFRTRTPPFTKPSLPAARRRLDYRYEHFLIWQVTPPPAWSAVRMSSGCDFSAGAPRQHSNGRPQDPRAS